MATLLFHQSGGCCDGTAPMCYPRRFPRRRKATSTSAKSGRPVLHSGPQFDYWKHTQLIIDVVPGRGSGFSVEAPEGLRFLTRSRVFTDAESDELVRWDRPPAVPKRWKRRKLEGRPSC